jgi:hypothetical protein
LQVTEGGKPDAHEKSRVVKPARQV